MVGVYVPTGIVLSGDSRTTVTQTVQDQTNPNKVAIQTTNLVLSDATYKLFLLHKRFGLGIAGDALINDMPIAHYVEKYESSSQAKPPSSAQALANDLLQYFTALNPIPDLTCIVAGYDSGDPWVMSVDAKGNATKRVNFDLQTNRPNYGIQAAGDTAVVARLLSQQQFNPPFNVMSLQDAVDFSRHLIRSTIDQLRFEPRFATVGGPIDTMLITDRETRFLSRKSLSAS